ncbi:MAG: MliC family protein [Brevundimonas sp.]|uniref:MliC family protein n=1 Tax=Brevundimonas sp. TaxID=1871086 RepID=UPI00391AC1CE
MVRACLIIPLALSFAVLAACGPEPGEAPTDSDEVRERALEAQTARKRTGAEIQERILTRTVRAVYLCNNGERLSVDFDNARRMATVRQASGQAVDLRQQQAGEGIWYTASGYELRGEGAMATWTAENREATTCRAVD